MTYDILATGSSGNAVVINGEIMIDCGIPMKKLRESGYIKSLKLVLLTHQHQDHFLPSTVRALHKERPALRWGCCEWMVKEHEKDGKIEPGPLIKAGVDKRVIDLCEPNCWSVYRDFDVMPHFIPHDVPNCGWTIQGGDKRILNDTAELWKGESGIYRMFYATDCSTLDGIVANGYDMYLVEANHRRDEIKARIEKKKARGKFSYEVRAEMNHLSEEQTMDWLARNAGPNSLFIPLHQHKEKGSER